MNANYFQLANQQWGGFPIISKLAGATLYDTDKNGNAKKVEIDCNKINCIDKYGYVDILLNLYPINSGAYGPRNRQIFYPQINIDYGYLDLS